MRNEIRWFLALAAVVPFQACGEGSGGTTGPPPPSVVTSVVIDPLAGPLTSLGEFVTLTATVRDQNGAEVSNAAVTWTSLDPAVVSVSATGRVVAEANGQTEVIAQVSGLADTIAIAVAQEVAQIQITPAQPVLELPGDTLTVTGQPVDARGNVVAGLPTITWTGSGVVTVSATGLVEAIGFGGGTVTANSGSATTTVTVQVIGNRFFLSQGTALRYDLDLPSGTGPFPAIVWVHGSGQLDRNSQRGATDPLVPEGLAVLRYDKRGVGESGGVYSNVGPSNSVGVLGLLADDAAAAVRFLSRLSQIDPTRIGIMGNSQAGWIVPQAVHKSGGLASYIMLWSGPTISVGLEIFFSDLTADPARSLDEAYALLPNFNGIEGYDALADVSALTIPGLWQFGEMDRSIPMRLDVQRLTDLQNQGKPFEMVLWPFGDHALRDIRVNQFYDVWSEYLRFLRVHGIL
jgi:hypothetical protein